MCRFVQKLWLKISPAHRKKEHQWEVQCRKIRQQRDRREIEKLCESTMRYGSGLKTKPVQQVESYQEATDGLNFVYKPPNAIHEHYIRPYR